jgi:hypothetical protein
VLGVLALSHVPGAAVWTGTSADTVSGSKIVAMPVAKRLQPTAAELGQAVDAVQPAVPVLTLLAGLVAAALVERARRPRSGLRPAPARAPPVALR